MIIFNFRKHSVAFFHAEDDEKVWIEKKSRELSDHDVHQIAAAQRNFSFLDFAYNWSSGLVPPLVLAPRFFEGEIEYGVIAQGGRAFRECFDAFSVVVQNMASLASLSASIDRLDELTLALQKIDDDEAKRDGHEDRITFLEEDSEIVVSDLHLQSPSSSSDKLMLPQGLSFSWGKDPSDRGLLVRKLFFLITLFFFFFFLLWKRFVDQVELERRHWFDAWLDCFGEDEELSNVRGEMFFFLLNDLLFPLFSLRCGTNCCIP